MPSVSLVPTIAQAAIDLQPNEERCYGWAYTTNNCFTGTFGKDGTGDGDRSEWSSTGGGIGCQTSVDDANLGRMPANDDSHACTNKIDSVTKSDHLVNGVETGTTFFTDGNTADWKTTGLTGENINILTQLECIDVGKLRLTLPHHSSLHLGEHIA